MALISVIIPYFNRAQITRCIDSLRRQTCRDYEIIVINNNSSAKYRKLLPESGVRIFDESVQGSYAARNRGIANSNGEYLAFIDADCEADENWLEMLLGSAKANNADMVLGEVRKIASAAETGPELVDKDIYHNHSALFAQGKGTTANLLVSKNIMRDLKGFSPDAVSGGDIEFIQRALDAGAKYVYAPNARVYHLCRKSLFSLMAKGFRTGVADAERNKRSFHTIKDSVKFLNNKCFALFDPFRKDITSKFGRLPISYIVSYYFHFLAHGLGRLIGMSPFVRTKFFRNNLRYT